MNKPRYRGEVLPDISKLSQSQIAGQIRHAFALDRVIGLQLNKYAAKHRRNGAAGAAVEALRSWLDVGMASIAAAENRREVSVFTRVRPIAVRDR